MSDSSRLDVWLFAKCVGTLTFERGRLQFTYADTWLTDAHAVPLSCSLPLQLEPFGDQFARPFFAGLLPEGQMRQLLCRQFRISVENDFALLNEIGGECAGAVTFIEHGSTPDVATTDDSLVQWLDNSELTAVLDELPRRPMLAGDREIRLSLAGAQSKLPVVFDGKRIGLPKKAAPSTHILKPAISGVNGSVVNEAFCLQLARMMKINAATGTMHQVENHRFLLVERYDRTGRTPDAMQRIHQEDFCQAMAVVPEIKYQNEGGPDFAQCFDLIRNVTRPSAPQLLRLLDYVFFNTLVCNNDAHAKNYSLLFTGKAPVLAPLYDVLCTAVYPDVSSKMAMKIGSKYQFDQVMPRHWEQFSKDTGLGYTQLRKRLIQFAGSLPATARKLQTDVNDADGILLRIVECIEARCELTLKRFQ
jgi:serine/threonine-protein kinase HipA